MKITNTKECQNIFKPMLPLVIDTPQSLLDFLKIYNCSEFSTKQIAISLKEDFNLPKTKTSKLIKKLKELGIIERRSKSGYCETTCASCYEYGCDAGLKPPINFWKILRWSV